MPSQYMLQKRGLKGISFAPCYSMIDLYIVKSVRLGVPLCWQEASELLDTTDSNSICSSPGSPMRSPMPQSPLRQSPLRHSPIHRSPLSSNSSLPSPLSCPSISALMGPMASERAEKVLAQWKGNKKEKVERLEDPGFGAERQGRRLAASEGLPWREW